MGSCALGGAARTANAHRLVLYEPSLGLRYPPGAIDRVEERVAAGDGEGAILAVLSEIAGMTAKETQAMRAAPTWPARLATAPTIAREARIEDGWVHEAGQFDAVTAPTLLLSGSESPPELADVARTSAAAISGARVEVLDGHGHFTYKPAPRVVADAILRFVVAQETGPKRSLIGPLGEPRYRRVRQALGPERPEGAALKRTEAEALARLAGQAARGVTHLVHDTQSAVHDAMYARLVRWFGPAVEPIRVVHRAQARHTFFWVHAGLEAAARVAQAVSHARASDVDSLFDRPRGHGVLGVLNGVSGDHLHRDSSALAVPMALRQAGRDVVPPQGVRSAYGAGHQRLAVFVHGLLETEDAWRYRARERWGQPADSYGNRLQQDLGYLPLWVRYNTGLGIATNGAALAELLRAVVGAWPDTVREIVLIGHSMGGLVVLSALSQDDRLSSLPIRAAITLGCPRDGAPLERHAAATERFARSLPATYWLGGLLGVRSEGVKDMHSGGTATVPIPPSIGLYAVLATLTAHTGSVVGTRIGDGLVPVPGRHTVETAVLGGLNHLDVLNHPRVYHQLAAWLAAPWEVVDGDPTSAAPGTQFPAEAADSRVPRRP